MKIIEERDVYIERTWQVQCTGKGWANGDKVACGSILEVNPNDLERYEGQDYPVFRGPTINFVCCKCKCRTDVPVEHDIWLNHRHNSNIKAMK